MNRTNISPVLRAEGKDEHCQLEMENRLTLLVARFSRHYQLSPQESRLVECASRGLSNKAAADHLGCSLNTMGTYWRRIYQKTDAFGQKEVLASLFRLSIS